MKASEKREKFLGAPSIEMAKVNLWLDRIKATPEEVIACQEQCKDKDDLAYFLSRSVEA